MNDEAVDRVVFVSPTSAEACAAALVRARIAFEFGFVAGLGGAPCEYRFEIDSRQAAANWTEILWMLCEGAAAREVTVLRTSPARTPTDTVPP